MVPPCRRCNFAAHPKAKAVEVAGSYMEAADFQQRVYFSVKVSRSVNQLAAEPKHTEETEQKRK